MGICSPFIIHIRGQQFSKVDQDLVWSSLVHGHFPIPCSGHWGSGLSETGPQPSFPSLHVAGSGHAHLGREEEGGVAGLSRLCLGTQHVRQYLDELPWCLFLLKGREVGEREQEDVSCVNRRDG